MEIVEYVTDEAMGAVIIEGGFEIPGRITFERVGPSKTKLTRSATVPPSIDTELIRRQMELTSRTIQELLESETAASP